MLGEGGKKGSLCKYIHVSADKAGKKGGQFFFFLFFGEVIKTSNSQGPSQSYYTHLCSSLLQPRCHLATDRKMSTAAALLFPEL